MKKIGLTGNDLATAEFGLMHAISWCKKQGRSAYWRKEIAKYQAVLQKLTAINDHAYPYEATNDESPAPYGDEKIMRVDPTTIAKTRATARKFNKENSA
jgi:hypothetical protein